MFPQMGTELSRPEHVEMLAVEGQEFTGFPVREPVLPIEEQRLVADVHRPQSVDVARELTIVFVGLLHDVLVHTATRAPEPEQVNRYLHRTLVLDKGELTQHVNGFARRPEPRDRFPYRLLSPGVDCTGEKNDIVVGRLECRLKTREVELGTGRKEGTEAADLLGKYRGTPHRVGHHDIGIRVRRS